MIANRKNKIKVALLKCGKCAVAARIDWWVGKRRIIYWCTLASLTVCSAVYQWPILDVGTLGAGRGLETDRWNRVGNLFALPPTARANEREMEKVQCVVCVARVRCLLRSCYSPFNGRGEDLERAGAIGIVQGENRDSSHIYTSAAKRGSRSG